MATRRFYVWVARRLQSHVDNLRYALAAAWLGGFLLILLLALTLQVRGLIEIGGRLWFSGCVLLGIAYSAASWFNPERDLAARSAQESWHVVMLNLGLVVAVLVWFLE